MRLFLKIIAHPVTPFMDLAKPRATLKSCFDFTKLPVAVATASAKLAFFDKTITESALPKLNEWPTVPEDEHTPKGVSAGLIFKEIRLKMLDLPA